MPMSRKHYREAAEIIHREVDDLMSLPEGDMRYSAMVSVECIARGLATMFQIDNSRFQRDKFMEACGIEE